MKSIPWVTVAIVAGFVLGFGLGAETRRKASGAVNTSVNDGKLTVEVDTYKMLREGAASYLDTLTG